jgi:hypothetical protein
LGLTVRLTSNNIWSFPYPAETLSIMSKTSTP